MQDNCHRIDGLLHLLVIAFVGLGDQFVDLAVGNLSKNAIAFADGQKNRVEHGIDAADDFSVRALELLRLAAIGKLAFTRGFGQAPHLFFESLNDNRDVVDCDLHFLVVAMVGLGDQLVDLAVGDLRENAVAFAYRQENGVQHLIDALNYFALHAVEQRCLAALGEATFLRGIHQAHDLVKDERRIVFGQLRLTVRPVVVRMSVCPMTISIAGAMRLPAFTHQCSWH